MMRKIIVLLVLFFLFSSQVSACWSKYRVHTFSWESSYLKIDAGIENYLFWPIFQIVEKNDSQDFFCEEPIWAYKKFEFSDLWDDLYKWLINFFVGFVFLGIILFWVGIFFIRKLKVSKIQKNIFSVIWWIFYLILFLLEFWYALL